LSQAIQQTPELKHELLETLKGLLVGRLEGARSGGQFFSQRSQSRSLLR
jgi:hypothetical protein